MRAFLRFLLRLPGPTRVLVATCLYGVAAGVIAVAFNLSIQLFFAQTYGRLFHLSAPYFLAGSLVLILSTTLTVGWLLTRFAPEAAGSGIPQLKVSFWRDFGYVPVRVLWVKFIAGVLSVGGGSSLGREGPSVQLAGTLASTLSGFFGEPKHKRRLACAAGAAAGLAAAFNTPLAAVTFVLEEIIGDLNSRLLGSVLLASVIGALVVHGLIGSQPAFQVALTDAPAGRILTIAPVVAAMVALLGVLFQKALLVLRAWCKKSWTLPRWVQPAAGALLTWAIGGAIFLKTGLTGVFGIGYSDLSAALDNQITSSEAAALFTGKFIATTACYGTGGCGGVFAPTLFLGAMCGIMLSAVVHFVDPTMTATDQTALALVGMSAFLGSVVRAPVTGILIVFEMTHDFALVPALMLAALVSQAISRALQPESLYDALLSQDGIHLEHTLPPRDLRGWLAWPVSAIANQQPVCVTDFSPAALRLLLDQNPYRHFPVLRDGKLAGLVTRDEISHALAENRALRLDSVPVCAPSLSIREVQSLLVDSSSHVVLLQEHNRLVGLLTLHDLLRAESNLAGEY